MHMASSECLIEAVFFLPPTVGSLCKPYSTVTSTVGKLSSTVSNTLLTMRYSAPSGKVSVETQSFNVPFKLRTLVTPALTFKARLVEGSSI